MKVIRIRECQVTKTSEGFNADILPKGYSRYFAIVIDEDGELAIDSGAYAGIIPCKNDYAIQIDPKVKVSDLTYILLRGGELNRSLETPFQDTVKYQIAEKSIDSFFEALVSSFLSQLDTIKRLGLLRNTERQLSDLGLAKGKPDLSRYRTAYPKSLGLRLSCWLNESVLDNPPNRLLAYCLRYLSGTSLLITDRQGILNRIGYFSPLGRSVLQPSDIQTVKDILENRRIPPSRYYYIPALNLALLILQGAGLTLGERQEIDFRPLVIDTSKMFESYIRALTKQIFHDTKTSVLNGKEFSQFFYDQARNRLSLMPDVVLSLGGKNLGLIDVKYKEAPTSSDHYQMWAYMRGYETDRGLFVSVVESNRTSVERFKKDTKTVYDFAFSLDDIHKSERELTSFLKGEFAQS